MALDSSNVRVGVTGAWYLATTSTAAAPTDTSKLGVGWTDLGYTSDDGVTEARDISANDINGWQNGDLLRRVVTSAAMTIHAVLVETKRETVGLYYGTKVAADGSVKIVPSKTGGRQKHVIDVIDGEEFIRTYIPQGEITDVGDQVYANGEPIGYDVTITAYPDPSILDDEGNPATAVKWYASLADDTGEE